MKLLRHLSEAVSRRNAARTEVRRRLARDVGAQVTASARTHRAQALNGSVIGNIMTRDVVTAHRDLDLALVADRMLETGFGGLPVVDDRHRPVGVVTTSDVLRAMRSDPYRGEDEGEPTATLRSRLERLTDRSPHPLRVRVADVMSSLPLTVTPHAQVSEAATAMAELGVHRLLVVDDQRTLAGIVTTLDLTRFLATI